MKNGRFLPPTFLIAFAMTEGPEIIRAGCRTYSIDEFSAHVAREYPDTPKAAETLRILDFLADQIKQEAWAR